MLEQILSQGFETLGVTPDPAAIGRYRQYYEALEAGNRVMNLTAITGEEDVARLHFLDCAALLRFVELGGKKVIDVGTGAGFPGLALKIARPEMELTLLDSLDKRVGFLRQTCALLGFDEVACVHARAEELPPERREAFDFALSRAVARLNVLLELCLPCVKVGGAFVAMKGPDAARELDEAEKALRLLGAKLERRCDYAIPGTDTAHCALIFRKTAPTPAKYPRRWAQIKKSPL